MKFAEHLSAHITPEWRKQYIRYEQMKDMLYEAKEEAPSAEMADVEHIERFYTRFDEEFFQFCDHELFKINTFFSEKLAEASRKIASLQSDLQATEHVDQHNTALRQRRRSTLHKSLLNKHDHKQEAPALPHRRGSRIAEHTAHKRASRMSDSFSHKPMSHSLHDPNQLRVSWSDAENLASSADSFKVNAKKIHESKLAFSEFYLSLILLQNYQTLNFTGFRKILKKHDKLFENERGSKWRQVNVETAPFYTSKQVDHLIKETESVFTSDLEGGNRQKAMKRLRVPPLGEKQNPWTTFRVGLFCGIIIVLVVVAIISVVFTSKEHSADWVPALAMYRGLFLTFLMVFFLGINTYGWRTAGVNHVLIFELDPRNHLTYHQLFELAGFFGVLLGMNVLSYLFSVYIHIPVFANPLCLVVFCIIYLFNPIHIMQYKSRMWLLRILWRILTAPFHHVGFADFWLADQLNSLGTVIMDFEFLICYYAIEVDWHGDNRQEGVCGGISYGIRPIVACLPAWWRFAQCLRRYRESRLLFPHIVNAGKYSTTFMVVLFSLLNSAYTTRHGEDVIQNNAFFYLWIAAYLINTCYTLTWDLKMDWGLLDSNAPPENRFLREEIVYGYKRYYYFAMIEDAVLRFSWLAEVTLSEGNHLHKEIITTIRATLEVFRRFVWNFFRLENEHLNNCGMFRAVRDISIAPIDTNDQGMLEFMMDNEDGVSHRTNAEQLNSKLMAPRYMAGR